MAITSKLYDAGTYTHTDLAEMFESFLRSGYVSGYENELEVVATDPTAMAVSVSTGRAILQGYWCEVEDAYTLTLEAADGSNPRIDRILLRLETATMQITPRVLKGTAASSPTAPALTRSTATYEISVAQVLVGAGVTSIVSGNITDERSDLDVCGIASSAKVRYSELDISGDLDLDGNKVTNLADPTDDTDAVSKGYFDTNVGSAFGVTKCDIIAYPGSSVPAGWLECNGQAVAAETYPNLNAIFGANLPDLTGSSIYGAESSLFATGGAKTHTLSEAEMAAHLHRVGTAAASGGIKASSGGTGAKYPNMTAGVTAAAGGGEAHNNLAPYMALRFIVRAS